MLIQNKTLISMVPSAPPEVSSATSVDLDLTLTLGDDDDVSEDIDDESSFDRRQSSMMSLPPLPEQLEQEARRQAEREERLERVERVLRTLRHAAARRFRDVAAMLRVPLLFGSLLLLGLTLFALREDGVRTIPRWVAFLPTLLAMVGAQLRLGWNVGRASCCPTQRDRMNPPPPIRCAQRVVMRSGTFIFHLMVVFFLVLEATLPTLEPGTSFSLRATPLWVGLVAMLVWITIMLGLFIARVAHAARDPDRAWQEPTFKMIIWTFSWMNIWLCFLFPQLLVVALKLDGVLGADGTWGAILVPAWIALAVFFACTLVCCVSSGVLCYCRYHAPGEGIELSNRLVATTVVASLLGIPTLVAMILLCSRESAPDDISALGVVSPLFAPWIIAVIAMLVERLGATGSRVERCVRRMRGRATERQQGKEKRHDLEVGLREGPAALAAAAAAAVAGDDAIPFPTTGGAVVVAGTETAAGGVEAATAGTEEVVVEAETEANGNGFPAEEGAGSSAPAAAAAAAAGKSPRASLASRVDSFDIGDDVSQSDLGDELALHTMESDEALATAIYRFQEGLTELSFARSSAAATEALGKLLTTLRENRVLTSEGVRKDNLEMLKRHGRQLFRRLRQDGAGEYDENVAKSYGRVLREMSTARALLVALQALGEDIFEEGGAE